MPIILGRTKDTALMRCVTFFMLLPWKTEHESAEHTNCSDQYHPLHEENQEIKGNRLKIFKSWMDQSEDIIQQACSLEDMEPAVEWFSLQNFEKSF